MEENVQLALLYDTYGELLNKHQRQIFEAVRFDDLSLAEVAEEFDISRQAAHDVYRRTVQKLGQYEQALHLVERDRRVKEKAEAIVRLADMAVPASRTESEAEPLMPHGGGVPPEGGTGTVDPTAGTEEPAELSADVQDAAERFSRIRVLASEIIEDL